jgi:hypothetical protein
VIGGGRLDARDIVLKTGKVPLPCCRNLCSSAGVYK